VRPPHVVNMLGTRPRSGPRRHAARVSTRTKSHILAVVATLALGGGAVGFAQKIVSANELDRAMKTIGGAFDAVKQAVESKSYADAKTPVALSRQVLASSRPFWEESQRPDVAKMTRDAVARLDALDKALSAKVVDAAAVAAAVADATRACDACHATARDGDEQTGYRIKAATR
jgi:hypothetical protein